MNCQIERKSNSSIEQRKCKSDEKRDQFLISKLNFFMRFPGEIKYFLFDPVFSNCVIFMKAFEESNVF